MKIVPGTQLEVCDQQYVLAAFTHRFTREHIPKWARDGWISGAYPVQFASDKEWLEHAYFAVRKDGRLDRRVTHCESNPTWPDNPEYRK